MIEWKDIIGYEGIYQISNFGNIKILSTGKLKKAQLDKYGYYRVHLTKNKKLKTHFVHRLVLLTFVENINNYPVVNHIDGNKINNHVDNLEWCTISYNTKHAYALGFRSQKGELNNYCKLNEKIVKIIRGYHSYLNYSAFEISKILKLPKTTVYNVITFYTWKNVKPISKNEFEEELINKLKEQNGQ